MKATMFYALIVLTFSQVNVNRRKVTINKNNLVIVIINQNCDDTEKDITITKANTHF